MTIDLADELASSTRAFYIAPAGCGKTEIIARAVSHNSGKAQLILTHTHAGVNSLRSRLKRHGVSSRSYYVTTIASFAQQYVLAYPRTSGLLQPGDPQPDWTAIYAAATRLFGCNVGKDVLTESFAGIYVDEYQDCRKEQHDLVVQLSSIMPCRIVGDPLQGIFEFDGGGAFSWRNDVADKFSRLSAPHTPWRWQATNRELGSWLLNTVRPALHHGNTIDLREAPRGVYWRTNSPKEQMDVCRYLLKSGSNESVVAMHRFPAEAHRFARSLAGTYSSMDELEGVDLQSWANKLEMSRGASLALKVIDFASECMTSVVSELGTIRQRLESNKTDLSTGIRRNIDVAVQLEKVIIENNPLTILTCLKQIQAIPRCKLFRYELWYDMCRTLSQRAIDKESDLTALARAIRDQRRVVGHSVPQRAVSRVLLIKGLEFNHAVVLDASRLNAKELYVAMTRGCNSLWILSPSPLIQVSAPFDRREGTEAAIK